MNFVQEALPRMDDQERRLRVEDDARALGDDPASFFNHSYTRMHDIDREYLDDLHLAGLRRRLHELRGSIAMLGKLADKQGIETFETINDAVPLLFEHTMYKSYPPSLLTKGRFADLNRWLSKLCAFDLTGVDVSGCQGIDDWMEVLDRETPLRIAHSSGTSGTMSFLPISKAEWNKVGRTMRVMYLQQFGDEQGSGGDVYVIHPYFRDGGSSHLRVVDVLEEHIAGGKDRLLAAYPTRMSSDVLHLAGLMKSAQARGDLDRLEVSPRLLQRKAEFEALESKLPEHLDAFFDRIIAELKGQRVYLSGTWNLLHNMAQRGLSRGLEGVFAPNSIVITGGGAKGMTPPENWKEDVCRFVGVDRLEEGYGMSEVLAGHSMCEEGHYHIAPWVVPFVLDGETSAPLARTGVVTGRAAFFELSAETRWGGFITGDEITMDWSAECPCGRTSAHIIGEIRRFSDAKGGDDKISCAATEGAHREAMDFLSGLQ